MTNIPIKVNEGKKVLLNELLRENDFLFCARNAIPRYLDFHFSLKLIIFSTSLSKYTN
jgi:hypothetical protein